MHKISLIKQHIIDKYEFVKKDIRLDEYKDTKYNVKQEHWIWWFFPTLKEGDSDTLAKTSIILEDKFIDELLKGNDHMVLWTKILNRICNKLVKHNYKNLSDFFRYIDVVRIRSFIYIFLHVYQFKLIAVPEFRNAIIRLKRFDASFDEGIRDILLKHSNIWILPKNKIIDKSTGKEIDQSEFDTSKNVFYTYTYDKIVESVKKLYPDPYSDKQYYWIRELIEQYNFIYDYDNITSVECREQLLNHMLTVAKLELSVETTINDPTKTIYALSDIHADIQAFIISLRDCAKVISKDDYNPNVEDPYLNYMLEKDLNTEEEQYDTSLGYRWIKPNTYVVICGDILDGARPKNTIFGIVLQKDRQEHDYLQSEIKLLMFINELNRQAIEKGSRIFKIMGNHDMENIKGTATFIDNYNSKWITTTQEPNHYYKKLTRNIVFTYNKIGFNILMKHNLYFGLVINNNLFVHGNMSIYRGDNTDNSPKNIIEMYDIINTKINNQKYSINQWAKIIYKEVFVDKLMELITGDDIWQQHYNHDNIKKIIDTIHYGTFKLTDLIELLKIKNYTINNIHIIIDNLIALYFIEKNKFKYKPSLEIYKNVKHTQWYDCNYKGSDAEKGECLIKVLYKSFYTWDTLWSREHIPENIDNRNDNKDWCATIKQQLTDLKIKRLIVGHCPQSNYNKKRYDNLKTLSILQVEDAVSMKFSKEIATGSGDGSNIGQIAGITGECVIDNNDFLVYHIDIASSRAFDSSSLPTLDIEGNERNLEIMGRTPQVLEINKDIVSVIKSKETNTRLHQHREDWEIKLGKLIVKPLLVLPKVVLPDISNNKLFLKHIYQMLLYNILKYEHYCSKYGIENSNQLSYDYIFEQMTDSSIAGGNYIDLYIKNKHSYEQFDNMYYFEIYKNNKSMYQKLY